MKRNHHQAVYSYTRFSTGEQRKGTGKQRQEKLATDWCKARGLALATNYADLGVSAFKGKNATHGALARFLDCVETGTVARGSILIVESLDRLSRQNVSQALQLFLGIINGGVTVVTLCDGKEYSADKCEMTDLMMSLLIFARANDESRMKSQRKAASWQHKRELAREGKPHGGRSPSWLKVTAKGYEIIESVAEQIRAVFSDYIAGLGTWKLYQKHKLPRSTVGYWLTSSALIGDLIVTENGHTTTIKDHYPKILDTATWRKSQQIRVDRYINRRKGNNGKPNLFAGLLFDAKGERFNVSIIQGRRLLVCPGCIIDADKFENVMADHVLRNRLIRTKQIETSKQQPQEIKLIKKRELLQSQLASNDDPATLEVVLSEIRNVNRQLKELAGQRTKILVEEIDDDLVHSLIDGSASDEDRLLGREIIRESVRKIVVEASSGGCNAKLARFAVYFTQDEEHPFRFTFVTARQRRHWLMLVGDASHVGVMVPNGYPVVRKHSITPKSMTQMTPELAELAREVLPKVPTRHRRPR